MRAQRVFVLHVLVFFVLRLLSPLTLPAMAVTPLSVCRGGRYWPSAKQDAGRCPPAPPLSSEPVGVGRGSAVPTS